MPEADSKPPRRRLSAERPGWGQDFDYDEGRHLAAYEYALTLAKDKRVLDAGCGEGFCTQTLCSVAREVVGVDYSAEAIDSAKSQFSMPNLTFGVENLSVPAPGCGSFDLIVNCQVIEHIAEEVPFLEGLKSRLTENGLLMITTPNRLMSFSENPCHLREYSPEELRTLLEKVFRSVRLLGVHGNEKVMAFDRGRKAAVERILRLDPLELRRFVPQRLLHGVFARLGRLVRQQARKHADTPRIGPEDFHISEDRLDEAVDLVALCRR